MSWPLSKQWRESVLDKSVMLHLQLEGAQESDCGVCSRSDVGVSYPFEIGHKKITEYSDDSYSETWTHMFQPLSNDSIFICQQCIKKRFSECFSDGVNYLRGSLLLFIIGLFVYLAAYFGVISVAEDNFWVYVPLIGGAVFSLLGLLALLRFA